MSKKLSCAVTALFAAVLLGSEVFGVLTAFDWALAQQIGFTSDALKIGAISAVIPSLAVAVWMARSAYSAELESADAPPPVE